MRVRGEGERGEGRGAREGEGSVNEVATDFFLRLF